MRTDDDAGIALAIGHLVSLGHERIAHVSAGDNPGAIARQAAYRAEMSQRGLREHIHVATAQPTQEGGFDGARELLSQEERPTAIVASNDFAALGVLGAVQAMGLSCPDDVSVVGYDNSIFAQLEPVQLTTINQPRFRMGEEVARVLREQVAGGAVGDVALEPQLVVRRTTARAR